MVSIFWFGLGRDREEKTVRVCVWPSELVGDNLRRGRHPNSAGPKQFCCLVFGRGTCGVHSISNAFPLKEWIGNLVVPWAVELGFYGHVIIRAS